MPKNLGSLWAISLLLVCSTLCAASNSLSTSDRATADGSCRVGLYNGKIHAILTATSTQVELSPDRWSNDDESQNWTRWLVDFDNDLYSNWVETDSADAQETVVGDRIKARIFAAG